MCISCNFPPFLDSKLPSSLLDDKPLLGLPELLVTVFPEAAGYQTVAEHFDNNSSSSTKMERVRQPRSLVAVSLEADDAGKLLSCEIILCLES